MDTARLQLTMKKPDLIGCVCILFFCIGCQRQDTSDDQLKRKITWSSARYSGAREAWVFKNFYSRIDKDLASVAYTVDTPAVEGRTDIELLLQSCSLARKEFGDAYQLGSIDSSYENNYTPTFVVVSMDEYGEFVKCAVILKFANLFDPNLKLSESQVIYDLPGRTNKEMVEKWKAAGEWQALVDGID